MSNILHCHAQRYVTDVCNQDRTGTSEPAGGEKARNTFHLGSNSHTHTKTHQRERERERERQREQTCVFLIHSRRWLSVCDFKKPNRLVENMCLWFTADYVWLYHSKHRPLALSFALHENSLVTFSAVNSISFIYNILCVCVWMCECLFLCVCVCVCLFLCVCVCVFALVGKTLRFN